MMADLDYLIKLTESGFAESLKNTWMLSYMLFVTLWRWYVKLVTYYLVYVAENQSLSTTRVYV